MIKKLIKLKILKLILIGGVSTAYVFKKYFDQKNEFIYQKFSSKSKVKKTFKLKEILLKKTNHLNKINYYLEIKCEYLNRCSKSSNISNNS